MQQVKLIAKAGVIGFVIVVLLIPLFMIQGVVSERQGLRDGVIRDIARSSSEPQRFLGPILVVPYRERVEESSKDEKTGEVTIKIRYKDRVVSLLPTQLRIDNNVTTEERYRGIHKALLYTSAMAVSGTFSVPEFFGLAQKKGNIEWKQAYVVLGIQDIRGIKTHPVLTWQSERKPFEPGTRDAVAKSGVHAPVGLLSTQAQTVTFSFDLSLQGMERLEFLPIGRDTQVTMHATWPHPSFIGRYLPAERTVTETGFDATWQTTYFSTNMEQVFETCARRECQVLQDNSLGVAFIQPVDIYLQAERAVKYGVLFIGLTFAAFFLFELFKRLAIHPVQYGLVGIALAIFYLLLLSLSEHLSFGWSYLIAGSACVSLLGFYASYVLKSAARSAGFTGMLVALYGVLFVLLRLEDYALLMGTLLLFVVLAIVMVITRNVDWYNISESTAPVAGR
ncbi:MAG: cell envelope integrity protein CreD [Nitrospira sp.]|nr:cell envelope integrity protein CreD [Nitrospira sp.]